MDYNEDENGVDRENKILSCRFYFILGFAVDW